MKLLKITLLLFCAILFSNCLGDRQSIIGQDFDDTSFVNKSFKGNRVDYKEGMSACDLLKTSTLGQLYKRSAEDVIITDPTKSNRFVNPAPSCTIHVKLSEQRGDHLTGYISVYREVAPDEFMGDVAEATGNGNEWEESWAMKKAMYKTTEWLPNMGKAALWSAKKRRLEIKFDGYTLDVVAPGAAFHTEEQTRNRDYKSIAIAMAKEAGFID